MTVSFELNGQEFTALNGGPDFKFTEAVSFVINCDTQEEIDYYWEKLTAGGGEEVECGWVADKYGLSWQVTPAKFFAEWVKDPAGLQRVTHEVWQMKKLDLAKLEKAFEGNVYEYDPNFLPILRWRKSDKRGAYFTMTVPFISV